MSLSSPEGVCIAPIDFALEPNPEWFRIDDPDDINVVGSWKIERGRIGELDKTDVGRASVTCFDTEGILDPTNTGGPFYGFLDPMIQAAIALQNPVTLEWEVIFRGFLADLDIDVDVSEAYSTVTLELVDAFDILGALEMTPGNQGDTAPAGSEGDIFFLARKPVNVRILQALADVGWPTSLQRIFSGNVKLGPIDSINGFEGAVYARRDQLLSVIFDCADAEFPGVANFYVSKTGVVTFHGRYARFFPERPSYRINSWSAGDKSATDLDPTFAPISGLKYRRSKQDIINAALALPQGVSNTDVPDSLVTDPSSILQFGWRSISFDSLMTLFGWDAGTGEEVDAVTETKKFASYYVDNYKDPKTRVETIRFRTINPLDALAGPLWGLMCGIDISDIVRLVTTHPGGGGFNEEFFVEGVRYDASPMATTHPDVVLEIDVSPRAFFDVNPFSTASSNDNMVDATPLFTSTGDLTGTLPDSNEGFSVEGDDPDAATSFDPIVYQYASLFTGPGGAYGDENANTHNFRTGWYRWAVPGTWDTGSSTFGAIVHAAQQRSVLLMIKFTGSAPPANGAFTVLDAQVTAAGASGPPFGDLTAFVASADVAPGDVVYIGVGSFDFDGGDYTLQYGYTP